MNKFFAILIVVLVIGGGLFFMWKYYPQGPIVTSTPVDGPGMVIEDIKVGEGAKVETSVKDYVYLIKFTGKLADGTVFDTSGEYPYMYIMGSGQKFPGLDKGLEGMNVGGKRVLIVPAELGYGTAGAGLVPPNATIVYEIELTNIAHVDKPSEVFDESPQGAPPYTQ